MDEKKDSVVDSTKETTTTKRTIDTSKTTTGTRVFHDNFQPDSSGKKILNEEKKND